MFRSSGGMGKSRGSAIRSSPSEPRAITPGPGATGSAPVPDRHYLPDRHVPGPGVPRRPVLPPPGRLLRQPSTCAR
ncbi:MAG: hypothetical protein MZV64_70920 [Ignavibacteriales bacterium]|nr:hypothetical protein [Ignavibacteriales bacterium]